LEEKELRKRVFVGDSNMIFDNNLDQPYEMSPRTTKNNIVKKNNLVKTKHETHAKGI
jgi:hypothetical protein